MLKSYAKNDNAAFPQNLSGGDGGGHLNAPCPRPRAGQYRLSALTCKPLFHISRKCCNFDGFWSSRSSAKRHEFSASDGGTGGVEGAGVSPKFGQVFSAFLQKQKIWENNWLFLAS